MTINCFPPPTRVPIAIVRGEPVFIDDRTGRLWANWLRMVFEKVETLEGTTIGELVAVALTLAQKNELIGGANTALHFHDADRARANHTGTQAAATISDFNAAADARVAAGIADHEAEPDPHPQYALDADLAAHEAAADPHPQYAEDTDLAAYQSLADKDVANGYAGLNAASRLTKGAITTDDVIIDLATKGLVLKDTPGTPHYWRVQVSTLGVLTTTDLGTSAP